MPSPKSSYSIEFWWGGCETVIIEEEQVKPAPKKNMAEHLNLPIKILNDFD